MGLDNIPTVYPCVKQGSAVVILKPPLVEGGEPHETIDCDATQSAGGCPWAIAAVGRGRGAIGMMGTDCWYRGKVGTYMLQLLHEAGYDPPVQGGFYGPDETNLSPEYCAILGRWMAEHVEVYARLVAEHGTDYGDRAEAAINDYRYAAWWLTWIAEAGDGAKAWW